MVNNQQDAETNEEEKIRSKFAPICIFHMSIVSANGKIYHAAVGRFFFLKPNQISDYNDLIESIRLRKENEQHMPLFNQIHQLTGSNTWQIQISNHHAVLDVTLSIENVARLFHFSVPVCKQFLNTPHATNQYKTQVYFHSDSTGTVKLHPILSSDQEGEAECVALIFKDKHPWWCVYQTIKERFLSTS